MQGRRWEHMAGAKGKSGNWLAYNFHQLKLPWDCHVWAVTALSPWNGRNASSRGQEFLSRVAAHRPLLLCGAALSNLSPCVSAISVLFAWCVSVKERRRQHLPHVLPKTGSTGEQQATAAALQRPQRRRDTGTYLDEFCLWKSMNFSSLNHQASKRCKVEVRK